MVKSTVDLTKEISALIKWNIFLTKETFELVKENFSLTTEMPAVVRCAKDLINEGRPLIE